MREQVEERGKAKREEASDVLLQIQDDAEPVMGTSRSCARCAECCQDTGRPSLAARLNGVDWTADELHLNGVCFLPHHPPHVSCEEDEADEAAFSSDRWRKLILRVFVQRFPATQGGTIPAIASHDTVALSSRFGAAPASLWRLWYSSFEVLCGNTRK